MSTALTQGSTTPTTAASQFDCVHEHGLPGRLGPAGVGRGCRWRALGYQQVDPRAHATPVMLA